MRMRSAVMPTSCDASDARSWSSWSCALDVSRVSVTSAKSGGGGSDGGGEGGGGDGGGSGGGSGGFWMPGGNGAYTTADATAKCVRRADGSFNGIAK